MRKTLTLFVFLLLSISVFAQEDPKEVLEKSFRECLNLQGGSFKMSVSKKAFNDKKPVTVNSDCNFLEVNGDSLSPYKFFTTMNNGDGTLCTSNDLVQLKGSDSTGIIYSRSSNQSIYRGAFQSEGLFPPFFLPQVVFSLDRIQQTTFIVRMGKEEEEALGKPCFKIQLIDLIRATQPDGQRQEKTFLIDKQTYLPVEYSEKTVMKLGNDSLVKENKFKLTEFNPASPHDSTFALKNIPPHFRLRNILETVYHHHLKAGVTAPDFKGKIIGADSATLKSFAGKKVLLCFISRSSYAGLKTLNTIQKIQNENKEMEVLLVGLDASEKDLTELMKKRNMSVKAISDSENIGGAYFISASPSFVLIDEKGIIKKIETGFGENTETDLRY